MYAEIENGLSKYGNRDRKTLLCSIKKSGHIISACVHKGYVLFNDDEFTDENKEPPVKLHHCLEVLSEMVTWEIHLGTLIHFIDSGKYKLLQFSLEVIK